MRVRVWWGRACWGHYLGLSEPLQYPSDPSDVWEREKVGGIKIAAAMRGGGVVG